MNNNIFSEVPMSVSSQIEELSNYDELDSFETLKDTYKLLASNKKDPGLRKLTKLVLFTLILKYPESITIGKIAEKIREATGSSQLEPPYTLIKTVLTHLMQEDIVELDGVKKYTLNNRVEHDPFKL